jgi:capsule polysaccharide export protein KpsE/RkpR
VQSRHNPRKVRENRIWPATSAASGLDLDAIYGGSDWDLWARLRRNASLEERQRYWKRMIDPFFDLTNGIVSAEVRAFRPADAQLVARRWRCARS